MGGAKEGRSGMNIRIFENQSRKQNRNHESMYKLDRVTSDNIKG